MQTLFAYYQAPGKTPLTARKELLSSFSNTYSLYMMLLEMVNELTRQAELQIEDNIQCSKITHKEYIPNRRFVDNRLAKQLFENRQLRNYITEQKLAWDTGMSAITSLLKRIQESGFYKAYMQKETNTYEDDRRLWRKIFEYIVPDNEEMDSALDEMELQLDQTHWTTDIEVIASYVAKTIKNFQETSTPNQPLLEMFDTEDELQFGTDLLQYAIEHYDEYAKLIEQHLRNWDVNRIAYMDKIILHVALAEILNFPDIALEVSLNEYLEMAKEYSSDKSHTFINGILDVILKGLREDDVLLKRIRN